MDPHAPPPPTPPPATAGLYSAERRRVRQVLLATVAVVVLVVSALDWLSHVRTTWGVLLARVLFLVTYLPASWLLGRLRERAARRLLTGLAVSSALALTLWSAGTGGSASPVFTLLWALPLMSGLLFLEEPRSALVSGVASALGVFTLLGAEGAPWRAKLYVLGLVLLFTVLATLATSLHRRVHLRELRLVRERSEALERVARYEREHARMERMATVGRLASGVAHEVNNPLAFVKSNLAFLQREERQGRVRADDAEDVRSMLAECLEGVDRIEHIVGELRTFAREDTQGPQACAVADLVHEALRYAGRSTRAFEVREALDPDLPPVRAQRQKVVQVLVNLLVNAADALEDARREGRAGLWIGVRAYTVDGRVRVEVTDNGPGLTPEVQQHLFEPFVTTKPVGKGTGLGLALSFEFMQRQGGELVGGNRPEGGARFLLTLPAAT